MNTFSQLPFRSTPPLEVSEVEDGLDGRCQAGRLGWNASEHLGAFDSLKEWN